MKSPYNFRICAALPGHEPIELMRSRNSYHPKDWLSWTQKLDRAWDVWVEWTTHEQKTITPRVKPGQYR